MDKIIIVGQGIVGNATWETLKTFSPTLTRKQVEFHDPARGAYTAEWREAQWCFICVNTDFDEERGINNDGQVFAAIDEANAQGFQGTYVLRSTVSLTTIDDMEWLGDRLVVWPEFVRAAHWKDDAIKPVVIPMGGSKARDLGMLTGLIGVATFMSNREAMTSKLAINSYLAAKVVFFNNLYDLCDRTRMDFDSVLSAVTEYPGIGARQSHVPGPDGERGYGGKCLPKDTKTFARDLARYGADSSVIESVIKSNSKVRHA